MLIHIVICHNSDMVYFGIYQTSDIDDDCFKILLKSNAIPY